VRGISEGGILGPDLTHLASRSHIGAGALPFSRAALLGWIANPQAAKPGARMPPGSLAQDDLQALAGWLETLR
jgi:cytochrome c oxidase subunit 2